MGKHKKKAKKAARRSATRATELLTKAGVDFATHGYEVDGSGDAPYALEAADALDVPPGSVFKTLVTKVDGDPVLALVGADKQLDLKALANSVGGSKATLAEAHDAERLTGYVVGGISPLGTKRAIPAVADSSILAPSTIYVSAGKRGLQVEVAPSVLLDLLNARTAPIARKR